MASENRLNQLVKGAPPPEVKTPTVAPLPSLAAASEKYNPDSHLASLPSAPPQIYLNLLILESSLRSQYLHLLSRRRINTFFLLLLGLWNAFFIYALFLRPREDGTGLGGSVYWVIETSEKLALMGGAVTVLLVWATGQWERGVKWPRRWLGTTNRGLRGFNLRVVVARRSWYRESISHLSFLVPSGLFLEAGGSDWHLVEHENGLVVEEDLAKGGDHVMLLLLPKYFSPEFRENWEGYRTEYWEKENTRRAGLRKRVKLQRRTKAQELGGWKWWTGVWKLMPAHSRARRGHDLEKHPHGHPHHSHQGQVPRSRTNTLQSEKSGMMAAAAGGRRRSMMRSDSQHSHSRQSSRSSTPQPEYEWDGGSSGGKHPALPQIPQTTERVRRGSSVSSTASVRKKPRERRERDALTMTGTNGSSERIPTRKREKDRDKEKERERSETPQDDSKFLGAEA